MLLFTVSDWVNRHQQDVIAYLVEENRVLKEQSKGRKLRLTDEQRRRLAATAKRLGRQALNRVATLVTPDTLMRWHRRLIALKWTYEAKRVGRPGLMKAIAGLIVRMAQENSNWGYCRIQGELKGLGHRVAPSTIAKVLKENGIQPAPDRPSSWRTFLEAHWGEVAGMDFFTTEVWTVLFEAMLEGRVTDEACWPKNRTPGMFRDWFEVQMSSVMQDLQLNELPEY